MDIKKGKRVTLNIKGNSRHRGYYLMDLDVSIGDVVTIKTIGDVYPSYKHSFKKLWGSDTSDYTSDMNLNDVYNKEWIVKGFTAHETAPRVIIAYIENRLKKKLAIDVHALTLVRKNSEDGKVLSIEQIEIE